MYIDPSAKRTRKIRSQKTYEDYLLFVDKHQFDSNMDGSLTSEYSNPEGIISSI